MSTYKLVTLALIMALASCGKADRTSSSTAMTAPSGRKTFASPSEAGAALLTAAQSGDRNTWLEIFGPDSAEVLFTGDAAQDQANLQAFVAAYTRMNRWGQIKAGGQTLYIGPDNYAFPIPLDKDSSGRWSFDTAAGKDEILARRIGRNELAAIAACDATAKGNSAKLASSKSGEHLPLLNGYYYRIAGKPGGSAGFTVLAFPAEYKNSGIMTFIVGKDGAVYQKDLGEKTGELAMATTRFNPSDGWTPALPHSGTASRATQ
uniref:DUF2950 domain-containing protein n=1 Tax=Solibacter usitatus (strain Ellin6076) TaxID=234267 RepID=Q01Z71_SOLUE